MLPCDFPITRYDMLSEAKTKCIVGMFWKDDIVSVYISVRHALCFISELY